MAAAARRSARRGARMVRRAFAFALAALSAVGIVIFTPAHAAPGVTASESALNAEGLGGEHDPEFDLWLASLRESTPDEIVRAWSDAGPAGQKEIRDTLPPVAGNLDGLPYSLRDTLNRRALDIRTALMRQRLRTSPTDATVAQTLAAYEAIAKALKPAKPRRQLITLTADQPPLAAISVGNLDTAENVTWQVPGMGTYTTDMPLWTLAAQNLYAAQGSVGAPKKRAVVAWMGYLPPPPPPSIEAARGFYAERGAPHLVRDLQAFRAVRPADREAVTVNVVGHSYGTTLVGDALAADDLGVESVVFLGSAGIETAVGGAQALHARAVYAGESSKDPQASLGRFSRTDPRAPAFGATVFGCDGAAGLRAVTGHAPILHSAWNDDIDSSLWAKIRDLGERARRFIEHRQNFGYLDAGTEALLNTASATTPNAKRALSHLRDAGEQRTGRPPVY
ncbi:alpha/beta hydrolase [Leifsonia sp. 22587]|uniref:alpha/beta hydrolase n=1 Tax=Leifsonia sp. 22587 TaxID=3453946 RepID=UPI003F84B85B